MALRTGSHWPDVTQAWRGLRLHSRTPRRRRARDSPAPRPPCGPKLPCAGWLHGSPARCGYGWSPRRSAVRRGMAGAGAWGCGPAAGAAAGAAGPNRTHGLGPMPDRGRNRKARVVTAAGISAAVLVAGGGAVSYATSRSPAPTYVTAAAGSHSVTAKLQATGTTEPSSAATVSFAVTGTVATVPVTMGQKVTAGEVLATLDTTSLKRSEEHTSELQSLRH